MHPTCRILGAAITLALCVAIAAPSPSSAQVPIRTVTDAIGRQVAIPTTTNRIVVTFNYKEFTAVAGKGGWTKVVGMSKTLWEGWRPATFAKYKAVIPNLADMPDVGNTEDGNFSAEKVIALKPDVILMADWSFQALKTAGEQLKAAGIPIVVIDYNAQTLERHLASTRVIGAVMGTDKRAEELAQLYEREYRDILRRIASAGGQRKKVYVELGRDSADTFGNSYQGTMWGRILDNLGAENIANGKLAGPWGPLSPEYVIAASPDVIFIAGSSWTNRPKAVRLGFDMVEDASRSSLKPFAERAGWAAIKAVQTGAVHAIDHGLARTLFDFTAQQYIAKQLYPEQFKDVDPVKSLREYHEKYLPVAFSGTWMVPLRP
jgi:ABC-type Fe3+-hydroxamate transport system substrate-binding protein